jgi:hypothetical protein
MDPTCGIVVFVLDRTFHTILTVGILRGGIFVPARTLIAISLLSHHLDYHLLHNDFSGTISNYLVLFPRHH